MASETEFMGHRITHQAVLNALAQFAAAHPDTNSYENWLEDKRHDYAIEYGDRLYPPKEILRMVSGETGFSGGNQTNRVFRDLGFTIVDKP